MKNHFENRVLAGFLAVSLAFFSVPVMPAALADGGSPTGLITPVQEKSATTDPTQQKNTEPQDTIPPADLHTLSLDDNPISMSEPPKPATRPFSAKAPVSPDGKDFLSVEVKEGGKASVTLTQYGQKQTYTGQFDEATQSIEIDNVTNGYSWNILVEKSGSQTALKRFDVIMNQTGYNYEQRYGFSQQRLSYIEYASSSERYGSSDSLYRRSFTYDAQGRWMDHTISVNRSTYNPSLYADTGAVNNSLTMAGAGPGSRPVTQYSIWTDIGSQDANGKPVKTSVSLYGGEEIQGIKDLYLKVRASLESGNPDYKELGQMMESHSSVFMKTAVTYAGLPAAWNNQLYSVESVRNDAGIYVPRLVRNKNDYQNVDIVVNSNGGSTPDQWKKLRFKNWQSVAVEGRNYSVSYGMTYSNKNGITAAGTYMADGRMGKPVYGLSFSSWYQDPVSKTWQQDQVLVENFPENRKVKIGGKAWEIELMADGVIRLKPVIDNQGELEALRAKVAAMINAASAEISQFQQSAASKNQEAERIAGVINPLASEEGGLFEKINGFDKNIPGMLEILEAAAGIHAKAKQDIDGVTWIMNWMKGDAALDQQDIKALMAYVEVLNKIAAALVPGTDPSAFKVPEHPALSLRAMGRPAVNVDAVIDGLKNAIVSERGLIEEALALQGALRHEIEVASEFAKRISLKADGTFSADINRDGITNNDDFTAAKTGYAQALSVLAYLPKETAALLDLNQDGAADDRDLAILIKRIANAMDKEGPVIANLKFPALTNKLEVMVTYTLDGIAKEQSFKLELEGENHFVITAQDEVGNKSEMAFVITRDTTLPVIKLRSDVPKVTNAEVLTVLYAVDGKDMEMKIELKPGMNQFQITAKDEAGNMSVMNFGVLRDNEAPVIRVLSQIPALTNQKHLVVEYVIDPQMTNGQKLRAEFDLEEGPNTRTIQAKDEAGNVGVYEFKITLDTKAPEITNVEHVSLTNQLKALVKYLLDGIPMEQTFELPEEGENHFVLTASDEAGNKIERALMIRRDTKAPEIAVKSEIPQITNAQVLTVLYTVDGKEMEKKFELAPGKNELRLAAKDEAGNAAELSLFVIMDNVAPVIRVISEIPSITNQKHLVVNYLVDGNSATGAVLKAEFDLKEGGNEFSIDAMDAAGNKGSYKFKITLDTKAPEISGVEHVSLTNQLSALVKYLVDGKAKELKLALDQEGKNRHVITESDEAGNQTEVVIEIVRDTKAPEIAITSVIPKITNAQVLSVLYKVDGKEMEKRFELKPGMNELQIAAKDEAGNAAEMNFAVLMDNEAPVIKVISQIPSLTNQEQLVVEYIVDPQMSNGQKRRAEFKLTEGKNKLKIEAMDEAGNIGFYEFDVTLDTKAPEITNVEHVSLTNQLKTVVKYLLDGVSREQAFDLPNEGKNELLITASDEAGNKSEIALIVVRDTQAPAIEILSDVPEVTNQRSLVVIYTADGVKMEKTFQLAAGKNELRIEAKDEAGNISERVLSVLMDNAGPQIKVVSEIPALTNQKHLVVDYVLDPTGANGEILHAHFDLTEGENKLKIQVVDAAGNIGLFEFKVTLDTIAPEIANIEHVSLTNQMSVVVSYTVDGEAMRKEFALQNEGDNKLAVTALDKAGNESRIELLVVRDTKAPEITGLEHVSLTNQDSAVVKYLVDGKAKELKVPLDQEGENRHVIKEVDGAGNETEIRIVITRDTIAPKISGVEHVSLSNRLSEIVKYLLDGEAKELKVSLDQEGDNRHTITAVDNAGNKSEVVVSIRRDTIPPAIKITSDIPETTNQATLKVLYTLDGGNEMEKTFSLVEGLNEGLFIEHKDEAGNIGRSEIRAITYKPDAPQNHRPVANAASFKVNQNGEITGFVTGSDEDGNVLSFAAASQPKHGRLEINAETGAFTYKPDADYSGTDEFSFTVNDGKEISEAAVIAFEIIPAGHVPVFKSIPGASVLPVESLAAKVSAVLEASDPDGGAVTFSIKEILRDGVKVNTPARMTLTSDGKFDWTPEPAHAGQYVITFSAKDIEGYSAEQQMSLDVKTPAICAGNSEVCTFLKAQAALGLAAGNVGDYYHNRDGKHTDFGVSSLPQLSRMNDGWAAEYATYPDRVIIGNSSTSGSAAGTSNPGSLESSYGAQATYNQYRANALYLYPEHIDHDAVDYYFSNNAYLLTSQGSSGSEMDEVTKLLYTLAAFRPEVKKTLKEKGLLMPTLEMIFRMTRVGGDEDKYLTGEAHPRAFNDSGNFMAMVRMANAMTLDDIPAFAQIKVEDENFGGTGNFDNKTEKMYDTPAAVSRIHRGFEYTKTMIVDAGASFDVNGHPLEFDWRVLRGDADHVRITKLNDEGSRVKIEIDYHEEASAPGSSLGSSILSNRVDVGLFVNNGHTWSSPAFISSTTMRNETRDYDANGVLKEIRYDADALSGQLGFAKGWVKDTFNESGGWTRLMSDGKTIDFTAGGYQVLTKDAQGRVLSAKAVTYAYSSSTRKIGFTPSGNVAFYEYADDSDRKGRISMIETASYRGRMIYNADGQLTGIKVESLAGQSLSRVTFGADGAVFLSAVEGESSLRISGNRTLGELIEMAGSGAAVIHILFKTAELLAAETGVAAAEFELRNMSFSQSPTDSPYDGYMGNLSMMFHNIRSGKDSWAYSWTQRAYPLDLYPDYPSQQGFHVALLNTAGNSYTYHDFSMAGAFMGTHAQDYEAKMKIRNLAAFQFEKDSGLSAKDYTFVVSGSGGRDGADGSGQGPGNSGYRIEVRGKEGNLVSVYEVNLRPYYSGSNGTVTGKGGTMYVINDASHKDDLLGYILLNGEYKLAWESHQGVETCHNHDVC